MIIQNDYVTFVYSEIKENMDIQLAKTIGKKFICGTVSQDSERKKYTGIVKNDNELSMYYRHYPDTKIVKEGYIKEITYTPEKYIIPTMNNN